MGFLFWMLWIFNLAVCLLTMLGKEFRRSFTATDPTLWFSILLIACLLGSLLLRLAFKRPSLSLAVVALPAAVLLLWYLFDKITASNG
ncbi:MAG: hypothetical protein IT260_16445 [Saprospiraceae bacterium]|nr:hypothetical protein [Saprospiraceae bacterium]